MLRWKLKEPLSFMAFSGVTNIFRSLKSRNYRLFFTGQSISLIGTWLTRTATSWLVYRLTGSALLLGIVGFSGQIPSFLFAPLGGMVADRGNRYKILILTQFLSMVQSFALAFLTLPKIITVTEIISLSVFQGIINAFDMPVRQSFLIQMVEDKEDLSNAIALNSSMVNTARLLGPSIAGVLIAVSGEGVCFLIDGFSYLAVIISLYLMVVKTPILIKKRKSLLHEMKEGFDYAYHFLPIRYIILLLALVSLVGFPYQVLMPVFAKNVLHGNASTLGLLMSFSGIGALSGALYLASRKSVLGLGKVIPISVGVMGFGLITFSFSRILFVSLLLMTTVGFGMMVEMATSNTILQTIVDDDKRGRVMSFYMMAFMGMSPFGSLLGGALANRIGAPMTIFIGGSACIVGALLFFQQLPLIREKVRPIYIEKGIIQEVALGIQTATTLTSKPKE